MVKQSRSLALRSGDVEAVGTSTRRANSVPMASVAALTDPRCCSGLKRYIGPAMLTAAITLPSAALPPAVLAEPARSRPVEGSRTAAECSRPQARTAEPAVDDGGVVMSVLQLPLVSRWFVELGLRKLVLADRVRFREELAGRNVLLAEAAAIRSGVEFLAGSGALQRALYLGGEREFLVPRRDWRCRLLMHHMVRIHDREIPHSYYLDCFRCGKFFDVPYHPPAGIVA